MKFLPDRTDVCAAVLMCGAVFLAATRLTLSKAGVPTSITQTLCNHHNWSVIKSRIRTLVSKMSQRLWDSRGKRIGAAMTTTPVLGPRSRGPPETILTKLRSLIIVLITWNLLKILPSTICRTALETWRWLIMVLTIKRSQALGTAPKFKKAGRKTF